MKSVIVALGSKKYFEVVVVVVVVLLIKYLTVPVIFISCKGYNLL